MPILRRLTLFACASLVTLGLGAQTQVYESTDAEGNPSFSDTPSEGSQEVTIEKPNVGDSVDSKKILSEPVTEPKPAAESTPKTQPNYDLQGEGQDPQYNDGDSADWYEYRRNHYPVRPHPRHR